MIEQATVADPPGWSQEEKRLSVSDGMRSSHRAVEWTEKNAVIKSACLRIEHGLLSAWLFLDYDGGGQGFGGYALYLPSNYTHSGEGGNLAGHFIWRVLEIAEVDDWAKLPGKTIRVRAAADRVFAIGHIIKDQWFDPKIEFENLKKEVKA